MFPGHWRAVAIGGHRINVGIPNEFWLIAPEDGSVWKVVELCVVAILAEFPRDGTFAVQLIVHGGGGQVDLGGVPVGIVSRTAAKGAGTVSCGQGDGFVEKEEFGVMSGAHHLSVPVFPVQNANDPGFVTPAGTAKTLMRVVKNAAVAHKGAALGRCDNLAGGQNTVLQGAGHAPDHTKRSEVQKKKGARAGDAFFRPIEKDRFSGGLLSHDLEKQSDRRQCGQQREQPSEAVDHGCYRDAGSNKQQKQTCNHDTHLIINNTLNTRIP